MGDGGGDSDEVILGKELALDIVKPRNSAAPTMCENLFL